jgi:hypothetical protein
VAGTKKSSSRSGAGSARSRTAKKA